MSDENEVVSIQFRIPRILLERVDLAVEYTRWLHSDPAHSRNSELIHLVIESLVGVEREMEGLPRWKDRLGPRGPYPPRSRRKRGK